MRDGGNDAGATGRAKDGVEGVVGVDSDQGGCGGERAFEGADVVGRGGDVAEYVGYVGD